MREASKRTPNGGLVPAFQSLTDGLVGMLRTHLELFRLEMQNDAKLAAKSAGIVVAFGAIAILGYGLLNLALVLGAYVLAGKWAMFLTCGTLALGHLVTGLVMIRQTLHDMRDNTQQLGASQSELERSKEWIKELTGPSS